MAVPGPIAPTFSMCSQCSTSHPPIPVGQKCPMAKEKSPSGVVYDFEEFMKALKAIMISQIQTKDIKDIKKFQGNILVEITKFAEKYEESR